MIMADVIPFPEPIFYPNSRRPAIIDFARQGGYRSIAVAEQERVSPVSERILVILIALALSYGIGRVLFSADWGQQVLVPIVIVFPTLIGAGIAIALNIPRLWWLSGLAASGAIQSFLHEYFGTHPSRRGGILFFLFAIIFPLVPALIGGGLGAWLARRKDDFKPNGTERPQ